MNCSCSWINRRPPGGRRRWPTCGERWRESSRVDLHRQAGFDCAKRRGDSKHLRPDFGGLEEKGPQRDARDREVLAPWVRGLEAARGCVGVSREFLAYELAVDELRIHLAEPALAARGASSPRRLGAAWEKVQELAPQRLRPME